MIAVERKPMFAPVPARAIGDERLSTLDLRVMMAIASHDRMSRNGVGCTAGHGRLAALVNCHLKSLSRSIRQLAECGYVIGKANPLNPKSRAYCIVYTDFDEQYLKSVKRGTTGNETVTLDGEISSLTGNQLVPPRATIGNQSVENHQSAQGDGEYNIFSEAARNPAEAFLRNPVETASPVLRRQKGALEEVGSRGAGAMLAMLERRMRDGKYDPAWAMRYLASLVGDNASLDYNDPNYHRAQRLLEAISDAA